MLPGLRIVAVEDRRGRDRFIEFPWSVYPGRHPQWVPPLRIERRGFLDPRRNPFFDHGEVRLFLAVDGRDRCHGRIAAIVNRRHNEVHHDRTGFFGLFECVDDAAVAAALFGAAAEFLRGRGLDNLRGPMSLSINDEAGLLVDGFDQPPMLMMAYNPPYYERLVTGWGFRPVMTMFAYRGEATGGVPERLERAARLAGQRHRFTVRKVRMDDFAAEVRRVQEVHGAAWAENWGAVGMTDREFRHLAAEFKQIIDPDLCFLAEVDGKVAGFSLSLPDINQALIRINGRLFPFGLIRLLWAKRRIDAVRIVALGVLKPYRHLGIEAWMYAETYRNAQAKGMKWGEASWILENNVPMNRALVKMGFRITKTYRLYDRSLA